MAVEYTTNNLILEEDGKFKGKKWGLNEVEIIKDNLNLNNMEIARLSKLSDSTVSRIRRALNKGYFDEFLTEDKPVPSIEEVTDKGTVNIYDGIHITIYNENHPENSIEENKRINTIQLSAWSKKVKKRGKYICAKCGRVNTEHSQAHHIFPKSKYPSLACDMGNGIVLCQSCHAKYHNKYNGDENPYTLLGWLNE